MTLPLTSFLAFFPRKSSTEIHALKLKKISPKEVLFAFYATL
jgi:hypothetical protein